MSNSSPALAIAVVPAGDPPTRRGIDLLERWKDSLRLCERPGPAPGATACSSPDANGEIDGLVHPDAVPPPTSVDAELPAINWTAVVDDEARDHFFERSLGHRRIRLLFRSGWIQSELMAFNTRERLRVIAHDPKRHRLMGRLVSKAKDHAREELVREIRALSLGALAKPVTRRKHANVLENVAEILAGGMTGAEREAIASAVQVYAGGRHALWPVLCLLREEAQRQGLIGLAGQSYLDPDPLERALRFEPKR